MGLVGLVVWGKGGLAEEAQEADLHGLDSFGRPAARAVSKSIAVGCHYRFICDPDTRADLVSGVGVRAD